jgi:diguanylate cyclase (GGDEF)-like protein
MAVDLEHRRVLLLAAALEGAVLRQSFAPVLQDHSWELVEADSVERAQFVLRNLRCDVLVVDEGLYRREGAEGRAWLAAQRVAAVVLLAGPDPDLIAAALDRGVSQYMPRELALSHPAALMPFLNRATQSAELRRQLHRVGEVYADCRQKVRQLVDLLGEVLPFGTRAAWFTRRLILERLTEELQRTRRYRTPLSLALGEVRVHWEVGVTPWAGPPVSRWVARRIDEAKRVSDVGGQFGPRKFMLLLVHTPLSGAVTCCRRLQRFLEEAPSSAAEPHVPVLAYFGVVSSASGARAAQRLLRAASRCLGRAKKGENDGLVFQ